MMVSLSRRHKDTNSENSMSMLAMYVSCDGEANLHLGCEV